MIRGILQSQSMKSFSRQVRELFSFAGYKTNAKRLPCSVTYSPFKSHQKLTYKCDVALKLYDYYKKHGFKYNEQGVTPKSIAEEIQLYVRDSRDYEVSIDSFGYFNITPSQEYLHRLERQIQITNKIEHLEIVAEGLAKENWHSENKKVIYIPLESFSLTNLRVAYYLSILKKKYQEFKQYKPSQIVSFIKAKNLGEMDLRFLVKHGIINPALKTCKFWNEQRLYIEAQGKRPELVIEADDEVVSGTVRHNYIPFLSKNQDYLNSSTQVMTFGDILPDADITQILRENRDSIAKILTYSLKFGINIPIALREEPQECYKPQQLLGQFKDRSNQERLLILLDYLQEDKIIDILALRSTEISKSDYQPFQTLFEQFKLIL